VARHAVSRGSLRSQAVAARIFIFQDLPLIDLHPSGFPQRVGTVTAPAPEFRRRHQAALHRIPVHVAQFLDAFAFAPDVEILESLLPDVPRYNTAAVTADTV